MASLPQNSLSAGIPPAAKPISSMNEKEKEDRSEFLAKEFNRGIRELLKILSGKCRTEDELAELENLQNKIKLVNSAGTGHELVRALAPFLLKFMMKIISRDEDFFNEFDLGKYYNEMKTKIDKEEKMNISLMNSIRGKYNGSKQSEKDKVYFNVKNLTDASCEYHLINPPTKK